MAVSFPGSGSARLYLNTALSTGGATVFGKLYCPEVPTDDTIAVAITDTSFDNAHVLYVTAQDGTYSISELAYWDSPNGPILSGIAPGTWVEFAIAMYTSGGIPAVKFALKPVGGSLATIVRSEGWWSGIYTPWSNAVVSLGALPYGEDPVEMLALDCVMYPTAITDDGDLEQQMDAIGGAEFASPYWVTSFRGYPNITAAAAKESGSATPTSWTVAGTGVTVLNDFDGGGIEGALSKAIGNITLAATGRVRVGAGLSKTIGNVTLSSTGKARIAAGLSKSIGAISLAGAGRVRVAAGLTKTLGAVTLSAEGALAWGPRQGALSQTLGPFILSGAGKLDITGELADPIWEFTLDAAGRLAIKAGLTATLADITLAAAATAQDVRLGALTATLGPITLEGAGKARIAAGLSKSIGDISLVALGRMRVGASLTSTIGPFILSGRGGKGISGQLTSTLAPVTLSARAFFPVVMPPPHYVIDASDVTSYLQAVPRPARRRRLWETDEEILRRSQALDRARQ